MDSKKLQMLVLSRSEVVEAVDIMGFSALIDAIETGQEQWGNDQAISLPAVRVEVDDKRYFYSYPACMGPSNIAGSVWLGLFPDNPVKYDLPVVLGIQIVSDTANGVPLAVMERSRVTEVVTAGFSAVGAKHLAAKGSRAVGIIGCGAQGRTHLMALNDVLEIDEITVFDIRPEGMSEYIAEMSPIIGKEIRPAGSGEEVTSTSDVVAVTTRPTPPIVKTEHMRPGALVIAGACAGAELYDDIFGDEVTMVGDDWENIKGMPEYAERLSNGIITKAYDLELGRIVAGRQTGRKRDDEKIVFLHVGMAVNHVAGAHAIYEAAKNNGIGTASNIL